MMCPRFIFAGIVTIVISTIQNKMWKCILFSMVILLFFNEFAASQSYYFRRYQVENGLSHNTVFCSLQDKDGFLWFGTRDGLDRFDGKNFKIFQHDPDDSLTFKNNYIQCLHEDVKGVLWVGSYKGLYYYNRKAESFTLIRNTESLSVKAIQSDDAKHLWFISGTTLFCLDPSSGTMIAYDPQRYFEANTLCKATDNGLWIGTQNGELKKYDPATKTFTSYNIFDKTRRSVSKIIEKIYPTSKNTLLIGTSDPSIKMFDIASSTCREIFSLAKNTAVYPRTFLETKPGEYWIGSESGVYIYSPETGKLDHLQKNYNNPYSLSDNAVYSLTLDKEGSVWVGTYFGGVNYYANQPMIFEKFFPDYTTHSISGNAVTEICQDKYGDIWVATEDAGVNKLDKKTNEFEHFLPDGSTTGISYFNIHCILITGDTLWIGTWNYGIDLLNIKTGKVIKKYLAGTKEGDLKNNIIMRLIRSRSGDVFIGTDKGLSSYDSRTHKFSVINDVPANETIYSILEDRNGTVWVGTKGQSIYYFNTALKQRGTVKADITNSNGLDMGLNQVTGITEDSNGNLWFATEGSGILNYLPRENKIGKRYTTKNGLPSNTIFKILEDENKNLWISTSKGLVKLNLTNDSIKIFTKANGLLNDQFNYNSGFKAPDGRMYFGSIKGLISFKPSDFTPGNNQPALYITGFQVDNKDLYVRDIKSPLKESIIYAKKITLKHDQSSFSIDFASLSFIAPEMLQYKYIMSGIDEHWTYLKNNRKVYYTDLPPGSYLFKLMGANIGGTWSDLETILMIEILPPFWASDLAYTLYALLLIGLISLIWYYFRKRSEEKQRVKIEAIKHEKEKQIYQAKIDFFTNIAHEIKTPLTLIKAPLERVIKKAGSAHVFGNNLKIMESNTEQLIELANHFLDFRKTETNSFRMNFSNINITSLLLERFTSFKSLAEEKNIQFSIDTGEEPVYAFADIASMQKILNNLFTNALNYCENLVHVRLYVSADRNTFNIEFSNDGHLVPENMKEMIFEPFYRMRETQEIKGTGIGLALSRSLAQMQKGEIYMKETLGGMNYFVVSMPMRVEG